VLSRNWKLSVIVSVIDNHYGNKIAITEEKATNIKEGAKYIYYVYLLL
jgi:hypothetical protein